MELMSKQAILVVVAGSIALHLYSVLSHVIIIIIIIIILSFLVRLLQ